MLRFFFFLTHLQKGYKKAAASVIKSVAKHSPSLAQSVVDAGVLEWLVQALDEFDPQTKEASAWALLSVARHTPELAQSVVDAGRLY
jgi:hypothetical protein